MGCRDNFWGGPFYVDYRKIKLKLYIGEREVYNSHVSLGGVRAVTLYFLENISEQVIHSDHQNGLIEVLNHMHD